MPKREDDLDLSRFIEAQEPCIAAVRAELAAGAKRTHWMWFVFPQMKGLGQSAMSHHFAISGIEEARAYLADPVLGPRLIECTRLVIAAHPKPIGSILGFPDNLKFRSSMTLFGAAAPGEPVFARAIELFFNSNCDEETLALLRAA